VQKGICGNCIAGDFNSSLSLPLKISLLSLSFSVSLPLSLSLSLPLSSSLSLSVSVDIDLFCLCCAGWLHGGADAFNGQVHDGAQYKPFTDGFGMDAVQ